MQAADIVALSVHAARLTIVSARVLPIPVRKVQDAMHFIADLTLHYVRVHDDNARR